MTYHFHPADEEEHLELVAFYESKRPGLGAAYLAEFEKVLADICCSPSKYSIERKPDIRHRGMKKFPFTILYRSVNDNVQVLAVAHHRRRPGYWLRRL